MSIRVVFDYPAPDGMRRFWRTLGASLGVLLVLVGGLASVFPIIYLIAVLAAVPRGGRGAPAPDVTLLVATAVTVTALTAGLRLVHGKRQLVLFLRRFGFTDATRALTFAVVTALGGSWRLITLDDAEVAPVGPHRRLRWLSVGLGVVGAAILAWGLTWVFGGGLERNIDSTFRGAFGDPNLREFLPRLVGAFFVTLVASLFVLTLVLVPTAFFGALAAFGWTSYGAVRRAERAKVVTINTPQRIGPAIESVVHRSRRILGPRLMVARVASSVWREVVRRLAATSSVVVIDVSEPTENLLWEIETIRPGKHSHWILVGESHHLEQMKTTDAGTMTPERRQLLQVIDGEEVLSYSRARADLRRFTRALGARLRVLGSGGRP